MAHSRSKLRLVIDTMAVIRGARAFRQQPPVPNSPELSLILLWIEDEDAFIWLYSEEILEEYTEVLHRLKVPRNAVGRFVNRLRDGGELIKPDIEEEFSPDPKDDPFYHCAISGNADYIVTDNADDFPLIKGCKRPKIIQPKQAWALFEY